jgi:hypothetical protein
MVFPTSPALCVMSATAREVTNRMLSDIYAIVNDVLDWSAAFGR